MISTDPQRLPSSAWALLMANVIPIFGVLFAGWDTFSIVLLYWIETAVIGALTILRMITASGSGIDTIRSLAKARGLEITDSAEELTKATKAFGGTTKFFLIPFFCMHFGIFMVVHLMFITTLLGSGGGFPKPGFSPLDPLGRMFGEPSAWLVLSILGLLASHTFSYFTNYIGKGEYRRTAAPIEMAKPYGRVVVMHIAILFGAFVSMALGSSFGILILLVVGKTAVDLKFHLREHRKRAAAVEGAIT